MNTSTKYTAFDYLVSSLHQWYGMDRPNDLSKLKVMKLLFFVSAISANRNDEGLLVVFDNFMALPYGHVESDIYSQMDSSTYYNFTDSAMNLKKEFDPSVCNVSHNIMSMIDGAVSKLKFINDDLVNYKAFDLVEISHKYQSWKTMYSLARKMGKYSMSIPKEMIMSEMKTFNL